MELTILIPCLNEEKTIGAVIDEANKFLSENSIEGEVLVIDNGSTDNSENIALSKGARVILVEEKGYGIALITGTKEAKGKYIIMGDADFSYDFYDISEIVQKLKEGYELVVGNRLNKNIEKGAMPPLHRYLGTPVISKIGNAIYKINITDYNCGLRGYSKEKFEKIDFHSHGFEYATEMLIKAKQNGLKITEVDINFRKDKRERKPHLRPIRDGLRHMKVLFGNIIN